MSTSNPHNTIPQPVIREPDHIVENIFEDPSVPGVPDLESERLMTQHLRERLQPDPGPKTRVVFEPTGRTLPGITRTENGTKVVKRLSHVPGEWIIRPRIFSFFAVALGSLALTNIVANTGFIEDGLDLGAHKLDRVIDPADDSHTTHTVKDVITPGRTETINVTAASPDSVGKYTVDRAAIKRFVAREIAAQAKGGTVTKLEVIANASDEWGNDASIAKASPQNRKLEAKRGSAAVAVAEQDGLAPGNLKIIQIDREHIISKAQKASLKKEVKAAGLPHITSAIKAVDHGKRIRPSLANKIKRLFTARGIRGTELLAEVKFPGHEKIVKKSVTHLVPEKNIDPSVPPYDPSPWFLPLIPIPLLRRRTEERLRHKWGFTPRAPVYKPKLVKEKIDEVWLRLRPEAVNTDGTLVENAWAYTRSYEDLLRDDRIKDVYRADFINSKEEQKALRVLFVDQSPADATLEMFERVLNRLAAAKGGMLADTFSALVVFPSENAGTEHGDPKRVGLGVDKQLPRNVLGSYTPLLKLIDMHMTHDLEEEELYEYLSSYLGPEWVSDHEAIHAADVSTKPMRTKRVWSPTIPNARIVVSDPWLYGMNPLSKILRLLPRNQTEHEEDPVEFDIEYTLPDDNDNPVTLIRRGVSENDLALSHAKKNTVYISGRRPTPYAGTNVLEHMAETGASGLSGIKIPFPVAGVQIHKLATDNGETAVFETEYKPDKRGLDHVAELLGAIPGTFPYEFANPPEVDTALLDPAEDQVLRQEMIRAKSNRTLRKEQMTAILARVIRLS